MIYDNESQDAVNLFLSYAEIVAFFSWIYKKKMWFLFIISANSDGLNTPSKDCLVHFLSLCETTRLPLNIHVICVLFL